MKFPTAGDERMGTVDDEEGSAVEEENDCAEKKQGSLTVDNEQMDTVDEDEGNTMVEESDSAYATAHDEPMDAIEEKEGSAAEEENDATEDKQDGAMDMNKGSVIAEDKDGSMDEQDTGVELPEWGLTSDAPLTIGDKIEIWLPKGTAHPSRKAWIARMAESDIFLNYRVPLKTPRSVTKECKNQGRWLSVRVTHRRTLYRTGYTRKPPLDKDLLPEHLRGPPPPADAPSWIDDTPPSTRDCSVTITIYAPGNAAGVLLKEVGGKGSVRFTQMGRTNCWRTPTPLPRGRGWSYTYVVETPGIVWGTNTKRSRPKYVTASASNLPQVTSIIEFGLSSSSEDKPLHVRAWRMAKSILDEATASLPDPTIQLYAETLGHITDSFAGDLSGVVNHFLGKSTNVTQVQFILTILGNSASHHIAGDRLLTVLNNLEPPSGIIDAVATAMRKVPGLFPKHPIWLALIRWRLSPGQLSAVTVHPVADIGAFKHSLSLLASWHAMNEWAQEMWQGQHLVALITKLLEAAPDFESLELLLKMRWTVTLPVSSEVDAVVVHANSAEEANSLTNLAPSSSARVGTTQVTIEQIIKVPDMLSLPLQPPRLLKKVLNEVWCRCLKMFSLTELVQIHGENSQYESIIRNHATDISRWDGTTDFQLSAVVALGFDKNKKQSKALLRNLTQVTSVDTLRLFPHLLMILSGVAFEKIFVERMTSDWVDKIVKEMGKSAKDVCQSKAVVGVSGLYESIAENWDVWNNAGLTDAREELKIKVLKLHKKPGYGGGMMLFEVAKELGKARFERTLVFEKWMLPSIKTYMEERCLDNLQSKSAALRQGYYAHEILVALTIEGTSEDLRCRVVASELCEQLLLTLLDVLQPSVPSQEMDLISHLVAHDQARFWPHLLRLVKSNLSSTPASGAVFVSQMGAHKLFKRILDVIANLGDQLETRSIPFDLADKLLSNSHKDDYVILIDYLALSKNGVSKRSLDSLLDQVNKLKKAHKALQHFGDMFCLEATDFEMLLSEIRRVKMAFNSGVPVNEADNEEHWGELLTPRVREVAATTYRLKESNLFKQEWESATKAIIDEAESPNVTTLVTEVYQAAIATFQNNCQRMLDTVHPITIGEIAHIFGTPSNDEQAQMLYDSLPIELDLMFQGREKTPREVQAVQILHDHLVCFTRLRKTLGEASAIRGVVRNILATEPPPATAQVNEQVELEELARQLIALGSEAKDGELSSACPLCELATTSHRFHQILLPTHKHALDAADQLGLPAARELLNFVRDLEDDALHDIVDSGSDDKADVTDAITSLLRIVPVLKPILHAPPAKLIGSTEGALEMLGARLHENDSMTGVELAGHIESCIANLYALTHRNKNMGDQAKDSIRAIVEDGTWVFHDGGLEVRCLNIPTPFSETRLDDLRSHALLGIDTRQRDSASSALANNNADIEADGERQASELFLGLIAASESIRMSIAELRMLGQYGVYTLSLQVKSNLGQLQRLQQQKARECHDWRRAVQESRERHYMLSFFASRQLWELYMSLCHSDGSLSHLLRYVPTTDISGGADAAPSSSKTDETTIEDVIDLTKGDDSGSILTLDEKRNDSVPMTNTFNTPVSMALAVKQLNELGSALDRQFDGAEPQRRFVNGWNKRQSLVGPGTICFVRHNDVLETCLALYADDGVMPAHCQVLFCSAETMHEEIEAFLHRAFHSYECVLTQDLLFCVLRIGALTESLYLYLKKRLEQLYDTVHPRLIRLALICDQREQHRISSDLASFVKEVEPAALDRRTMREALLGQRRVVVVSSDRAGLGKTRVIRSKARASGQTLRTVPISGHTSRAEFVSTLLSIMNESSGARVSALHLNILDIPASCAEIINDMLFELLCLNMICSSAAVSASLVFVPCATIYIELANSIGHVGDQNEILQRAPILNYFGGASEATCNRVHLRWDPISNGYQLSQPSDDAQTVCRFLQALDNSTITDDVPHVQFNAVQCWALLDRYFVSGHVIANGHQPSFAQLQVFVRVLADQFRRFEDSAAFLPWVVQEVGHPNVRATVVRCLVDAAARFATRSVPDGSAVRSSSRSDQDAQIAQELRVQSFESVNYCLLLMQKSMAITVFPGPALFGQAASDVKRYYDSQRQMAGADLALPEWRDIPQMLTNLTRGATDLLDELINFLGADARRDRIRANFEGCRYTLTADNALKMMLIHVRISAGEPVILSGETGCGKTSLIKFLLFLLGKESDFLVLNVHAGIGKERITAFVRECEKEAKQSDVDVWVFFDEVNTSPQISIVSELMCRRTLNGRIVHKRLRFLACVNPHRLRTRKVESVGLQEKQKDDPMRRLVYRVHKLPQAMLDYVFDYGRLAERDEASYIANMLSDSLLPALEAKLVFRSQCFIREVEDDCSVSLRDVRRFKKLVSWFYATRIKRAAIEKEAQDAARSNAQPWWENTHTVVSGFFSATGSHQLDEAEVAIVLALAHCYYCRLPTPQKRQKYLELIEATWRRSITQSRSQMLVDTRLFLEIIDAEQREYVCRMDVPEHLGAVAINSALLENIFVMLVCVVNRLPVFLVGKPGCSKTLSMQLILENLRGKGSNFPHLPCVYGLRYQCSEDSTSEGIEAIFESAKQKAVKDDPSKVTYVVVLDEIGLAEVSRYNPLKVLHDRLEPDARQEYTDVDAGKDGHDLPYAVAGISNWALDSSKMNRAIVLSRPDPSENDLEETAVAMVKQMSGRDGKVSKRHLMLLKAVSKAYHAFKQPSTKCVEDMRKAMLERGVLNKNVGIAEETQRLNKVIANFHGLRDFYALNRTIGAMPDPDPERVAIAVARNFNGLPGSAARFQRLLCEKMLCMQEQSLNVSSLSLIGDNLRDPRARHLMLISRGDAALCLLRLPQIKQSLHKPHLMLASSFKEDSGAMYDYQQLSRISQHMIAGRQLIIKDFDSIYGALYDMLNQTYLVHKKRKCRVALENASKQVEVHSNFRCIMIEEERDLQHSDPPRLNRCEKQCLTYLDMLDDIGLRLRINSSLLLSELQSYCHDLSSIAQVPNAQAPKSQMEMDGDVTQKVLVRIEDAFLGFSQDSLPSLLIREMQAAQARTFSGNEDVVTAILSRCKATLHDLMPADAVARSKFSLFGLNPENEEKLQALVDSYLNASYHTGLKECLQYAWPSLLKELSSSNITMAGIGTEENAMEVEPEVTDEVKQSCLLVLTFTDYTCSLHSILSARNVDTSNMKFLRIGAFESEKTLRAEVNAFWTETSPCDLLLIQVNATQHSQHLLLTREIMREAEEAYQDATVSARRPKAQVIVLHLRRFQSAAAHGRWEFSHLSEWKQIVVDRLEGEVRDIQLLKAAQNVRDPTELMTEHFESPLALDSLLDLIKSELPWALRRLSYPHSSARATLTYVDRICKMLLGDDAILERLEHRLSLMLTRSTLKTPGDWLPELASDLGALVKASSLIMLIREVILSSVREPLALLLHQLEGRSALAGLRSCSSTSEKALWLELYLPNDEALSVLGPLVQPPGMDWSVECLPVASHTMQLHWAFSNEFKKQLQSRKAQIIELCAPLWSPESMSVIIRGLCHQFLEEPLLRRLAILSATKFGDGNDGATKTTANSAELSRHLESLWMEKRVKFKDDIHMILANELASRNQGITADRISTLINAALLPACALHDEWHPANICIQHWRIEPMLQHALQLFLLINDRFEMSGEFAVELVDCAAHSCLAKPKDDAPAWLATALRCINYTRKIEEDSDARLTNRPSVWQLQLCADFCQRVVLKLTCRHLGQAALTQLAQPNVSRDEVANILGALREELSGVTVSDEVHVALIDADGIESIEKFKFFWIMRQLEIATAGEHLPIICRLGSFLQTGTWVAGEISPTVACVIHAALDVLGLFELYDVGRGNKRCFDGLTSAIEASMRSDDAALAGIICSELQQSFVHELQEKLDNDSSWSATAASGFLRKRSPKRRCLPHEFCANLPRTIEILQMRLNGPKPQASALYHLAYAKAFVQVACTILVERNNETVRRSELAVVLNNVLAERSTNSAQLVVSLQEYVLKELRRSMSMDELMQSFRNDALGTLLPNLKARCDSAIALPTASKLGFDPFATYGDAYRTARKALQTSCDGKAPAEASDLHSTLYAVTTALYLPRTLQRTTGADKADAFDGAWQLVRDPDRQTSMGQLIRALAKGATCTQLTREMVLSPQTPRLHVCLSSLAVHLAAVLDLANPNVNPFALYAKRPADARELFMICTPSNEIAIAMRAASVPGHGHANKPYRCDCGFMYVVGNCGARNQSRACPQCGETIGGGAQNIHAIGGVLPNGQREFAADKPGYIVDDENAYGEFTTLREMNAVSFRALHLLTHLSLHCGRLLGTSGLDMLVVNQGDPADFCWGVALRDFQLLPGLLGPCSEIEACAWLHDLIERIPGWCQAPGGERGANNRCTNAQQRQAWEAAFGRELVRAQPGLARACVVARPLAEGPRPMLHRLVDEEVGLSVEQKGLWSIVNAPTLQMLQGAFLAANGHTKYRFLNLCLDRLELLELTQYLMPFVQWERLLREQWSSRLDRGDAREMSVAQLLSQTTDSALRNHTAETFEHFATAWNGVVSLLRDHHEEASGRYEELCDCHPVAPADMPLPLLSDDHITRACIDPEICADPAGNLFRLFLHMLAKAQNDFLDMVINMVPLCEALVALSLGGNAVWLDSAPQAKLLQMQRQHALLDDVSQVRSCLLGSCVSQTGYGVSGRVTFDFATIEMNLASLLLTGSRYVDVNADEMGDNGVMAKQAPPIFVFKGELLPRHKGLNRRVSELMEQETVANARALRQDPFLQEPKNCRETLEMLEIVLYTATKSMPAPDERLASYCNAFNRTVAGTEVGVHTRVFDECKAIGEVPLKQLCSLYELVEDLVANAVLPLLPSQFCVSLPSVEIADKACLELGRHVISMSMRDAVGQAAAMRAGRLRLEPALKRFIYRELKPSAIISNANLDAPLYHKIRWSSDFPWTMGDAVSDEEIDAAFDEAGDPALKHTYALWRELQRRGGSTPRDEGS